MDSGLIFAIVVALWLACLIPDWIRRREHLSSSRTKDRFSGAMRVLARRRRDDAPVRPAGGPVYVLGPPLAAVAALGASAGTVESEVMPPSAAPPAGCATSLRSGRTRPGWWRRVRSVLCGSVLVLALLATPALAVMATLGTLRPAAPLASLAVAIGTLAVLRWTAVLGSRAEARRRRTVAAAPAQRRPVTAVVVAPSVLDRAERREDDGSRRASSGPITPDGTWTPVPVPPPTYLLKAAAPLRPAPPAKPAAAEPPLNPLLPDLDVVLERRRAAGD